MKKSNRSKKERLGSVIFYFRNRGECEALMAMPIKLAVNSCEKSAIFLKKHN